MSKSRPASQALVPATPTPLVPAASLAPELMAQLLREQRATIQSVQRLPAVKVMPAAAGLFEFSDTNETARTFEGIILHNHPRNVLWDKPYGEGSTSDGDAEGPACQSDDGERGAPRAEFVHLGLGRAATAGDFVSCGSCAYNRFGSAALFPNKPGSGKGKACTNQRSIYVLVDGRHAPMELVLSPTSLRALDEYLALLLNHGIPAVTVRTVFAQEKQERGRLAWSVVTFERGENVSADDLDVVLALRDEYAHIMHPRTAARGDDAATFGDGLAVDQPTGTAPIPSDDLPF